MGREMAMVVSDWRNGHFSCLSVQLTVSEQLGENAAGTVTMTFLPGKVAKFNLESGVFSLTSTAGTLPPTVTWEAAAKVANAE